MDGGQVDGQEIMVTMCKPSRAGAARGGGGGGGARHKFDHDERKRFASLA